MSNPPSEQSSVQPSAISHKPSKTAKTVLAIASAGGHWIQLRRLHPAFEGTRLIYATTRETYRGEVEADGAEFRVVPDCNRWEKLKLIKAAFKIFLLLLKEKPDVVISTGAAPGYFAIRLGKMLGKKTIWVDSIANAEELSLSGKKAGQHVDHWITQWKHLARPEGPYFFGNVLGDDTKEVIANDSSLIANPNKPSDISDKPSEQRSAPSGAAGPSAISHQPSAIPNRHKDRLNIFVTVGTDLPFDRLVRTLDDWAPAHPEFEIFAQIGETSFRPQNIPYTHFIEPPEFKQRFQESDLIVSHAGMGTILSSLSFQKPLLVMPRIAAKGEHRNEHQLATAKHLKALNKINVAPDEKELLRILESLQSPDPRLPITDPRSGCASIGPYASQTLTAKLNEFIKRK